jgi:hypothetical protein
MYTFKELVQELESERDTDAMGYQGIANERFVDYAFEPAQCRDACDACDAYDAFDADSQCRGIRQTQFSECNTSTSASRCAPLQFPAKRNRQQQQADGSLQPPSQPQPQAADQPAVVLKKPKLGEVVSAAAVVAADEAASAEAPRAGGTVMST